MKSVVVLLGSVLSAQTGSHIIDFNRHGWFSYSGDHEVRGKWGIHFDGQWRRSEVVTQWQQYQLRSGVNFQANDRFLFTLGYAFTRTYPYGEFPVSAAVPEHRIYQQMQVRHSRRSVALTQRYRLEQRFIRYAGTARSWTYQNRFRYLLKGEFPLSRSRSDSVRWYLAISDEVLIGIPPNYGARPFDQNRLFLGIGRSLGEAGKVEAGYLNQFIGQRNGRVFESNYTLSIAFTSSVPLSKLRGILASR